MRFKAKIVGAVVLFDLLFYPLLYFVLLPNTDKLIVNLIIAIIRVVGCSAIGLLFAYHGSYSEPPKLKKVLFTSVIAGFLGVFYLFNQELYIPLIDLVWVGAMNEFYQPHHFIRIFLSENLFDQWTVLSYMCLIITFQLSQYRFSQRTVSIKSSNK